FGRAVVCVDRMRSGSARSWSRCVARWPNSPGRDPCQCPDLCAVAVVDDDSGSYSGFKLGGCPLSCGLRVRSAGYDDFVAPVAKFCTERSRGMCGDVAASFVLQPTSPRTP